METVVAAALAGAGLPVAIANPGQIRAFAKAIGQRAKTDPIDAAVIAHFNCGSAPWFKGTFHDSRRFGRLVGDPMSGATKP